VTTQAHLRACITSSAEWFAPKEAPGSWGPSTVANSDSEGKEEDPEDPEVQEESNCEEEVSEDLVSSAYPARFKAQKQAANNKALKEAEVGHTRDA
jgi:hypothetical protein